MEAMFHYMATAEIVPSCPLPSVNIVRESDRGTVSIQDHFLFDGTQQWRSSEVLPHPTLTLMAAIDGDAYRRMKISSPPMRSANICAIADSGAQACLIGIQPLRKLGLRR